MDDLAGKFLVGAVATARVRRTAVSERHALHEL